MNTKHKWDSYLVGPTKYERALDMCEHARAIFEDIFEFKQVEICYNYSKDEIIDKMESL